MSNEKIRVLIVDDSTFIRRALRRMLSSDPAIAIVGDAKDGAMAIEKVRQLKPDVITLDMHMPGMDGLETLNRIMTENPTPVLMVSSSTSEGSALTFKALEAGAVDFVDKSACNLMMDILEIGGTLIEKIHAAAGVDLRKIVESKFIPPPAVSIIPPPPRRAVEEPSHLVALGVSTGGPMAIEIVLTALPRDYSGAIVIVQHMPLGFTRFLAERLNRMCRLTVKEAEEGDKIEAGTVYIAPSGRQLKIRRTANGCIVTLTDCASGALHCPSVDAMMESVAEAWPGRLLGIVMTGMGEDGAKGVQHIKRQGGKVIAQDEETSVVFGMPKAAHRSGCVSKMVPLHGIAEEIKMFARSL